MSTKSLPHDWIPEPLPGNIQIGPRSWLYSTFAFVHYRSQQACGVQVGHDTGIYNGTFFDIGTNGQVIIGNYCTLVGAILSTNGLISIGDYTFIAHEVTIADHFAATPPNASDHIASPRRNSEISIGPNVWIGARATILRGADIGEGAIVGAACVVNGKVPPHSIIAGNPARILPCRHPAEDVLRRGL
jgi:acetyltransferase-like isoleucine patch superfamily enzyme